LEENKDSLKILYLPKGSPEFNAVEENVGDRESMIYWYQNIIQDLMT
jgi:transposase